MFRWAFGLLHTCCTHTLTPNMHILTLLVLGVLPQATTAATPIAAIVLAAVAAPPPLAATNT
jgi:hypothetical protein